MRRRTLVTGVCAAALTACASRAQPPATFVLVHGAWHGGWCWERVIPHLQAAGHAVRAPTLPGMGERRAELSTGIDLDSHVRAVVDAALQGPAVGPLVLVGHSYGGFVITGAADRLTGGGRLRSLIYLDAFVPQDGARMTDYMSPASRDALRAAFDAGNAAYAPLPAKAFGISDAADVAWVDARLTPHPAGTYLQPIRLRAPLPTSIRRSYIECSAPSMAVLAPTQARLRADPGWTYRALAAGHDAMITAPRQLADLLLALG
jgi:pimeloyl-ACP methyl ester carboxylesterase